MVDPKVSILRVNYNSSAFINLALESLQGIKEGKQNGSSTTSQ